jgi:hypothetical protein
VEFYRGVAMTSFHWLRSLAGRLVPSRRAIAVFSVLIFSALAAGWCLWDRPWEAHYHGRPSSYWARWLNTGCREEYVPYWIENLLPDDPDSVIRRRVTDYFRRPPYDLYAVEIEPVLVDLLSHRDLDVRKIAAEFLSYHGLARFRQALPVLLDIYQRHHHEGTRFFAIQAIAQNAVADPASAKVATPVLLRCHDTEPNPELRNTFVEILRKLDPEAKELPPLVYDFRLPRVPSSREGLVCNEASFDPWILSIAAGDNGGWTSLADPTSPSGGGHVLARAAGSTQFAVHAIAARRPPEFGGLGGIDGSGPPPITRATVRNIEVRVSIKAIGGTVRPGGGVLWRCSDANNYYAAEITPRDGSLRLHRIADGKSTELGCKDGLRLKTGEWHRLSVKHIGDKIQCSVDGTKCLETNDTSIAKPGTFGLWTQADAETHFDGLRVIDYGE